VHDGGRAIARAASRDAREKEAEEVAYVALAHAVVHPRAVVVEPRHAAVADAAVLGARRSRALYGDAKVEANREVRVWHFMIENGP
jgi:hypothetical protein